MKKIKIIAVVLALILVCGALCACGDKNKTDLRDTLLMVAAYTNNAVVDGELVVKNPGEYAFVPYGKEISKDNIVTYTASFDLSNLVGVPNVYEFEGDVITGVVQGAKSVSATAGEFVVDGDKISLLNGTEIIASDDLKEKGEEFYYVSDGWSFTNGALFGEYGVDQLNDDVITFYDIDADGTYDYATYKAILNGLEVVEVNGTKVVLNGGFGSAAALDVFAPGSKNTVTYKKTLSMEALKKGDIINATISIDASKPANYNDVYVQLNISSVAETLAAPLTAVFAESETDVISRVNGKLTNWTTTISENDAKSGRNLMTEANLGNTYKFVYDEKGYIVSATAVDSSEVKYESLVGYTTYQTPNGTQAAALLDVQGTWHTAKTYSQLSVELNMLHSMGIRRVYVVITNPGYPMFSWATVGYSNRTGMKSTINAFQTLGFEYPDHAIVDICHKKGMECYAEYKPYEGGGMTTSPLGAKDEEGLFTYDDFYGTRRQFDAFNQETLANGEDYRVCRRPDGANDNLEGTVDKITVDFIAGAYPYRAPTGVKRDEVTTIASLSKGQMNLIADGKKYSSGKPHPYYNINVWVSADNSKYALYEGDYSYQYKLGEKVLYDCNDLPMFDGAKTQVITLEITDIAIDDYFVAVTFENTQYLRTDPLSLMHLYVGDRELVTTSTDFARNVGTDAYDEKPDDYVWGRDIVGARSSYAKYIKVDADGKIVTEINGESEHALKVFPAIAQFPMFGFEFNFESYPGQVRGGNSFIAIGRGVTETFPGGLCEGYQEVRDYWLEHVETTLKASFDGIVIRLQSHNSIATDYINYGFNEPIVEKYKEIYGEAAYNTLMDPSHKITEDEYLKICKIRGDFLYLFLEDAAELCHKYGAEFSTMLREGYVDPQISYCQNEFTWWTMPKVILDWQKIVDLSDFVYIKDYIHKTKHIMEDAKVIRAYAQSQDKEVWIDVYDEQAGAFNKQFFSTVVADPNTDGMVLYELTGILKYYSGDLKDILEDVGFKVTFREDRIAKK